MTRIVFHAYSAYVGSVTGPTTCSFWSEDPSGPSIKWNPAQLVPVDLSKNPKNARASGNWGAVEVDDHMIDGGMTTIGPLFPGGTMIGACWLADTYVSSLGAQPTRPGHSHAYEFRSILYANDPTFGDRRFQGFHANILHSQTTTAGGTISLVQLWIAGTGRSSGPAYTTWLDLDAIAHPVAADATQVGPKGAPSGALFLDSAMKTTYTTMGGGTGPKIPPGMGLDY